MCKNCDWENALDQIQGMQESGDYDFAEETLAGIQEWVEEHEHITDRQQDAIDNIEKSIDR